MLIQNPFSNNQIQNPMVMAPQMMNPPHLMGHQMLNPQMLNSQMMNPQIMNPQMMNQMIQPQNFAEHQNQAINNLNSQNPNHQISNRAPNEHGNFISFMMPNYGRMLSYPFPFQMTVPISISNPNLNSLAKHPNQELVVETIIDGQRKSQINSNHSDELKKLFPFLKEDQSIVINCSIEFPNSKIGEIQPSIIQDYQFLNQPHLASQFPPNIQSTINIDPRLIQNGNHGNFNGKTNLNQKNPINEEPLNFINKNLQETLNKNLIKKKKIDEKREEIQSSNNQLKINSNGPRLKIEEEIGNNTFFQTPIATKADIKQITLPSQEEKRNLFSFAESGADKNKDTQSIKEITQTIKPKPKIELPVVQKKKIQWNKKYHFTTGPKIMQSKRRQKIKKRRVFYPINKMNKIVFKVESNNANLGLPKHLVDILIPIYSFSETKDDEIDSNNMKNLSKVKFTTAQSLKNRGLDDSDTSKILKMNTKRINFYWTKKSLNVPTSFKRIYCSSYEKNEKIYIEITDYSNKKISTDLLDDVFNELEDSDD